MKNYYGRRVRIYEYENVPHYGEVELIDTGKTGRLLEIDISNKQVIIEDETGELIILFYKLIRLI